MAEGSALKEDLMKTARRCVTALVMAAVLCMLLANAAFAAEAGSLWVTVEKQEGTVAQIVTDAVVTDGLVKLTYDSAKLTFEKVEVAEQYVAMFAVNSEKAGEVLISWVAPGTYEMSGDTACLIRVYFTGIEETSSLALTGTAYGKDGSKLTCGDAPNTAKLEKAVADAEALKKEDYTAESYAKLEKALADAKALLASGLASQKELDDAEAALRTAIAGLVKDTGTTETESTAPTESTGGNETEESKDPTTSTATKPTESSGSNAPTGDDSHIILMSAMGLLSAAGIVFLSLQMNKKKGGYAR
jgi:hypothetical protein